MRRLAPLLVLLALPAAAQAADETVATLDTVTPLRASGEIVVWSRRVPDGFQLAMRRGSGPVTLLPVQVRERARGFDVGSDAKGRPLLTYTRCKASCDIYTSTLAGKERRIAAASAPHENEAHPAVSNGRLAWIRGRRVYTRKLSDPRGVPSRRLFVMPRAGRGTIDDLDISGTHVGFFGSFEEPDGRGAYIVRSVDARTGRVRKLRDVGTGEAGQFLYGLGFHAGQLGFGMSCGTDIGGCGAGAFRYRGTRKQSTADVRQAIGFTLSGPSDAYVLQGTRGDGDFDEGEFRCPCVLTHRTGIRWR